MKKIRKRLRPSPAMIVAVVALSAALVGTAVAGPIASISLSKKEKRQTAKIARKQANRLFNKRRGELVGPQGPKGDQGPGGPKGEQGPKGDTGTAGASATRLWASVDGTGTLSILHGEGVTAVEEGGLPGLVNVTFDRDVSECAFQATPVGHGGGYLTPTVTAAITTGFYGGSGLGFNQIRVTTYYEDAPAERDFDVAAFC